MDLTPALILGVIQGVTEWLPVSSSAQNMFFMVGVLHYSPQEAFTFSVCLHFGTLMAVALRFRRDLTGALRNTMSGGKNGLLSFMAVATLSSMVSGLPLYVLLKGSFLEQRGIVVTAFMGLLLVATGLVLYSSKAAFGLRRMSEGTGMDALAAGFFQGVAVLPGISRSGITSAVLLLRKFRQDEALKLTFIISIPAVLGLIGVEALQNGFTGVDASVALAGISASFAVGYVTIDLLLRLAGRIRFDLFCVLFGLFALAASTAPYLLN